MFNKRINIFTGHFGSGKTEVAVNFAIKLSELYDKTAIVDFDIVNPYFRTADAKSELERRGILVILPLYANTNVDVPSLPPEINGIFERKEYRVVFDVGGDDIGAKALSRYRDEILKDDYEMFFVVNTRRPMTDTDEKIGRLIAEIEYSSRLKVTGIVNNTNLLEDTTADDLIQGGKIIEEVSKKLNIPVAFTSGFSESIRHMADNEKKRFLELQKFIKLPWE
ncbi:MAG: hypothetical protein QHH06_00565 [Clostridiales bacterium]|jgi:hypothetical protein|nr:hypothetical protein [Eubacteriales bacterium]MDH7564962.1 hypothetical protein [Clostridiales bacterium]